MVFLITFVFTLLLIVLTSIFDKFRKQISMSTFTILNYLDSDIKRRIAPGPKSFPLIGSLHLLAKYSNPFEAFTALSKIYGSIYNIKLGTNNCVVVNNYKLIKEVLITKGGHFGGRPDFIRFHQLFGGDRNNSLALCDWSDLQKTRRSISRLYCSPRFASTNYDRLSEVGSAEVEHFLNELSRKTSLTDIELKPLIMATCGNMFTNYMCSTRFAYDDKDFSNIVYLFDEIFWEINQGYAVDFLPWLLPFYSKHMKKLSTWTKTIREFILSRIIEEHRNTLDYNGTPRDFTDALLIHLEEDPELNWQHIIYELEDFLGGHSAIGNLVMLALAAIVKNPEVGLKIQEEIERVTDGTRNVNLFDKPEMPFTEATILETLRSSSSPIVPHVANQDTTIAGYSVDKGTVVFINNYELNMSEEYWTNPQQFQPERFISKDHKVVKPEHFIPFSTGKRTCIGQRLVQGFSFVLLSSILQHYNVSCSDVTNIVTYPACVALPPQTFSLTLTSRHHQN